MAAHDSVFEFRIRYADTDQMGTYYYAHALEWFEVGRTEWTRGMGMTYAEMERRGVYLPVVEAYVCYRSRAQYDDLLRMTTTAAMAGRARVRFDMRIVHADTGVPVAEGHTVHAVVGPSGKAIRPPDWFLGVLRKGMAADGEEAVARPS